MWKPNEDFDEDCESCIHCEKQMDEEPCSICLHNDGSDVSYYNAEYVEDDNVNHPNHYCQEGSMECIDEMIAVFGEDMVKAFCLLNVWKYRKRAIFKNGEEDLKKSDWYLKKYIELGGF